MKHLHRSDLFGWSQFDKERDLDFHGTAWIREGGNVVIDPLPLGTHDAEHLSRLGGVATVIVTNSDHLRDAETVARAHGARLLGPHAEQSTFPLRCDGWLSDGDEPLPGLRVLELWGSKTPGELALLLEETTLVTGDLIRAPLGGQLALLPPAKLKDPTRAWQSVERLARLGTIDAVLVGDGWPVFREGTRALQELLAKRSLAGD